MVNLAVPNARGYFLLKRLSPPASVKCLESPISFLKFLTPYLKPLHNILSQLHTIIQSITHTFKFYCRKCGEGDFSSLLIISFKINEANSLPLPQITLQKTQAHHQPQEKKPYANPSQKENAREQILGSCTDLPIHCHR